MPKKRKLNKPLIAFASSLSFLGATSILGVFLSPSLLPYRDIVLVLGGAMLGFGVLAIDEYFVRSVERAEADNRHAELKGQNSQLSAQLIGIQQQNDGLKVQNTQLIGEVEGLRGENSKLQTAMRTLNERESWLIDQQHQSQLTLYRKAFLLGSVISGVTIKLDFGTKLASSDLQEIENRCEGLGLEQAYLVLRKALTGATPRQSAEAVQAFISAVRLRSVQLLECGFIIGMEVSTVKRLIRANIASGLHKVKDQIRIHLSLILARLDLIGLSEAVKDNLSQGMEDILDDHVSTENKLLFWLLADFFLGNLGLGSFRFAILERFFSGETYPRTGETFRTNSRMLLKNLAIDYEPD